MRYYLHYFNDIHSIFRYVVLLLTLIVAVQGIMNMVGKKEFTAGNRKMALFMMIACDIQLLLGLAVYYINGNILMLKTGAAVANHYNRFYSIEHPISMILGIVLVHLAYSTAKKSMANERKIKRMFWYSLIALVIFIAQTPWPSKKDVGKPMFPAMAMNK